MLRLTLSLLVLRLKGASVLLHYRVHLQDVYRDKSTFVLGRLKFILFSQRREARFAAKQTSGKILYFISVVAFKSFRQ